MPVNKNDIVNHIKDIKSKSKQRKFLEAIDLTVNLKGLDLKKPENRIDTELSLPHPVNKSPKVCVIATGDLAVEAKSIGVNLVIEKPDLERYGKNKKEAKKVAVENDFFIAQADLMPLVGKILGPTIAPRGKMPKPGTGIIPPNSNIKPVLEKLNKIIKVAIKKDPVIHMKVGNRDMSDDILADNIITILNYLEGKLERGKQNIRSIYIKTTMGQPIKIQI